jgi:hypothetical protein
MTRKHTHAYARSRARAHTHTHTHTHAHTHERKRARTYACAYRANKTTLIGRFGSSFHSLLVSSAITRVYTDISTKACCQNMSTAVTDRWLYMLRAGGKAFTVSRESMKVIICFLCPTLLRAAHFGKKLICHANLFSWNFTQDVKTINF